MYWLLGPKSQHSLESKTILNKTIVKPVWSYGIQLWGTARTSNIKILQRYQPKTLIPKHTTNAASFANNNTQRC